MYWTPSGRLFYVYGSTTQVKTWINNTTYAIWEGISHPYKEYFSKYNVKLNRHWGYRKDEISQTGTHIPSIIDVLSLIIQRAAANSGDWWPHGSFIMKYIIEFKWLVD